MDKAEYTDSELGRIFFIANRRAKRVIARRVPDGIQITIPVYFSAQQAFAALEELRPKLSSLKGRPNHIFLPDADFKTLSFSIKIEKSENLNNFYFSLQNYVLTIVCPHNCVCESIDTQNTIRDIVEKVMRNEAKRIFPALVSSLAQEHGFTFTDVKINKSRSRWGSCSSGKNINLSYMCMLLPRHLCGFVILHELCHTVEMNHSPRFWNLLDSVTDKQAKKLTEELKKIKIPFWR
ncbi:putative metal-dependent hydrolase [Dysgonomonas sp. PH5-45]|uniref:M48 family metallopeptidase n=1 Tax=unclassified Dysgonomonas TaxID=2630389 RepID=UPI002477203E|nr:MULTISPECIES: YgjP-like metallopeptidase domain-containing protein [unclassified Dysgonomonas]MDH6355406.1 putative metal-dependent hydrolase [Dysgonomonas sp. PH5-45]MDH6388303.1 putative metal-dependent hydrolase [Dysgonomonas sp. PH5-37]